MKRILIILATLITINSNATDCQQLITTAKNYVNTYIVPNGNNMITGTRANVAFNYIINALKCADTIQDLSFTKNASLDSFVIVYKGVRFAVKDSIGSGGGSGTITSIATDLTLTGGTITTSGTLKVDTSVISTLDYLNSLSAQKQNTLISGTNIKTVNGASLLGSGNVVTGTVTTIGTGYGLTGGTITNTGTLIVDTSVISTLSALKDSIDNLRNVIIVTDTTLYTVISSLNTPPASPNIGDVYLVGNSPTGLWLGHNKDVATWDGSIWTFIDGVQGNFLYNASLGITYIFRSGNWVQTGGIPILHNGNTITGGVVVGTNNNTPLVFETQNIKRGRFDSIGNFYLYNTPNGDINDTFVVVQNPTTGKLSKIGKSNFSGGGGGQIAFTKTKAEIDTLIAGGDLVAGALYEITGVHPTLYDDGTTSGTMVYLRAISGSKLEVQGMGKFYNPKYNQSVDGFGIWDNKMYGTFSSISGTFDYLNKEAVTADNSATGILLADGMIQWVSGDWSTATSITGGTSGATANVVDFVSPSYAINDKVIWGGYSWTNVNGNVGASTDVLNLDSEWKKDVYDTSNYNVAYDLIEYDYANDMIIRRFEKESNVDVTCSKAQFDLFYNNYGFTYHSISVQQFGNAFNTSTYKGIFNKRVINAYDESINFCGAYQFNLTFGQGANQSYLTFGQGASQFNLTFGQGANQSYLTFGQGASQFNLTFGQYANQNNLTFGQGAYQSYLTFGQGASQSYLTFGQGASQFKLTFGQDANQNNLTFGQGASQFKLTFGQDANQNNLTFGQGANQSYLTFGQGASQYNLTFNDNIIQRNIEFDINTQLDYSSQTLSTSIINARFRTNGGAVTIPNISTATYIYDNTLLKDIYTRPDGTLKLKYMNDSDVLVVKNITD